MHADRYESSTLLLDTTMGDARPTPNIPGETRAAGLQLVDLHQLHEQQTSASLKRKVEFAAKILAAAAEEHGRKDPVEVEIGSSTLVISLLWDYTGLGKGSGVEAKDVKAFDTLANLVTALRWVYDRCGHVDNWRTYRQSDGTLSASGNPLRENVEVKVLKKIVKKFLVSVGKVPVSTIPLTSELLILIYQRSWCVGVVTELADRLDVEIHAMCVVGMNCGLRFDELEKIDVRSISLTPTGASFGIDVVTKNVVGSKDYTTRPWPGSALAGVHAMCPRLAMAAWMKVRGNQPGPFFCDVRGEGFGQRIVHSSPLPSKRFCERLRQRAREVGWSQRDAARLTGHSIKRGGVQLLRKLGMSDSDIMEIFKMSSVVAYIRYTELSEKACSSDDVPKFTSYAAFMAHANTLSACAEYADEDVSDDEEFVKE